MELNERKTEILMLFINDIKKNLVGDFKDVNLLCDIMNKIDSNKFYCHTKKCLSNNYNLCFDYRGNIGCESYSMRY